MSEYLGATIDLEKCGTKGNLLRIGNMVLFFWEHKPYIFYAPGIGNIGTYTIPSGKYAREALKGAVFDTNVSNMTAGTPFEYLIQQCLKYAYSSKLLAAEKNKESLRDMLRNRSERNNRNFSFTPYNQQFLNELFQ
jgi:hypothetical protein